MTLLDDLWEEAQEILRRKRAIIELRDQHRKRVMEALQTEKPEARKRLIETLVVTSTEEFEKIY